MIIFFKNIFSRFPYFYSLLSFLYHFKNKYWQPRRFNNLFKLLEIYASKKEGVYFIQVGANDGLSNDPLNNFIQKFGWVGICIEPIPMNFDRLSQTYKNNAGINLLNAAIGDKPQKKIYYINPEKAEKLSIILPEWYSQLASFDKDLVISDINGERKSEIVEEMEITCISFEKIICDYKIKKVELLHIDTEGADWMILSSFPFHLSHPDIIIFEHSHLNLIDYKNAIQLLKGYRYKLLKVDTDTFCYSENFYSEYKNAREKSHLIVK